MNTVLVHRRGHLWMSHIFFKTIGIKRYLKFIYLANNQYVVCKKNNKVENGSAYKLNLVEFNRQIVRVGEERKFLACKLINPYCFRRDAFRLKISNCFFDMINFKSDVS